MNPCHMCKSENVEKFLDLGEQPHSDGFLGTEELKQEEPKYPLDVYLCKDCGLVQLGTIVSGKVLYNEQYRYEQSTTETGRTHYNALSKLVCNRFSLPAQSLVVDIGSNVGVLLSGFKDQGMTVLGVDPAPLIAAKANDKGIETLQDFFTQAVAQKIVETKGKAAVVTGTNIFAHLPDLHETMKAVNILLKDDGIFLIELPYLVDLLDNMEYDTVYHQHLRYMSIKPLSQFLETFGMEVFDVERIPIHGGSIRVFMSHKGTHPVSPIVKELIALEEQEGVYSMERLNKFAADVAEQRRLLKELVLKLKSEGKRIVAASAPAKGNTLLNYCNLDTSILDYTTEKADIKVGLFTPGTHLPIHHDSKLVEDMPDYALILAWNFADEIMRNLSEYREKGGKFIIPIPKPRIV